MKSTTFFRSLSDMAAKGGMPRSARPFFTTGAILSPLTSCPTRSESVKSGPLWPPVASRPWQKPHCATNVASPLPGSGGRGASWATGVTGADAESTVPAHSRSAITMVLANLTAGILRYTRAHDATRIHRTDLVRGGRHHVRPSRGRGNDSGHYSACGHDNVRLAQRRGDERRERRRQDPSRREDRLWRRGLGSRCREDGRTRRDEGAVRRAEDPSHDRQPADGAP